MMYFEYHKKNPETIELAKEKYSWLFFEGLTEEGVEARYYLLNYLYTSYNYNGILEKDSGGKPVPILVTENNKTLYWSVSHTDNYIAYIVSYSPTGIDIAENVERNRILFDTHNGREYDILGEKNWTTFYTLWTAKEAIIKCIGGSLDDIKDIKILSKQDEKNSLFVFKEQTYTISTLVDDALIISYISH